MTYRRLQAKLDEMAGIPGIDGCALVEIDTGMVWCAAGGAQAIGGVAEAASDYWRLNRRISHHFEELGPLNVVLMVHAHGRITMLPCGSGTVLLALTGNASTVNWDEWRARARELAQETESN